MWKKLRNLDSWTKVVVVYLVSGVILGKAAAYVGLLAGAFLPLSPRVFWNRFYLALTRRDDLLHRWSWALLISLLYGFAQTIYGVLQGYPPFTALQILVFNLCPLYVFLGLWVGSLYPSIIRIFNRYMAWFVVFYTPLYFTIFNKLHISLTGILPGTGLYLLGETGTGSPTLIGLLSYEPNLAKFWLPILVLTCLTIANQERADWLGLGLALMIWGFVAKKMGRMLSIVGVVAAVLIFAAIIDLRLPPIPGRGAELSARETVARMAGSISPDMAEAVGGSRANAHFYYGTVYWRKHWWAAIREEVGKENRTMIFGMGYGYPLARLAGREVEKEGTRSPHNILYFCYAYSGLIGMALFVIMEGCMFHILWRVYRATGQIYGFAFFAYQIVQALFGNSIETPQDGIFVYLFAGMAIGPLFHQVDVSSSLDTTAPLHDAIPRTAAMAYPEMMEPAGRD